MQNDGVFVFIVVVEMTVLGRMRRPPVHAISDVLYLNEKPRSTCSFCHFTIIFVISLTAAPGNLSKHDLYIDTRRNVLPKGIQIQKLRPMLKFTAYRNG